jgi:hypothetical protein
MIASSSSLSPPEGLSLNGQPGLSCMPGSGMLVIRSATRSASCSYLSLGAPIFSFGWMDDSGLHRGQPPPQAQVAFGWRGRENRCERADQDTTGRGFGPRSDRSI